MFIEFTRSTQTLFKFLMLLVVLAIGSPLAGAQGNCGPTSSTGLLLQDFNPGGPQPPQPPGKTYHLPDVLRDEFLVASWLQGFYNAVPGYGRGLNWGGGPTAKADFTGATRVLSEVADLLDLTRPRETDALVLSKYFVDVLRQQAQVGAVVQIAKNEVKNNAAQMKNRLACGQAGTYSNRGREIVMGDDYSFSVHVAIGSFSVFWEASCQVGPKRCCLPEESSESGFREEAAYSCRINFTIYDNYNFSVRSGTGGTGLLKAINPLGWFGTSFHQYGRWHETVNGTIRNDMTVAAAACCRRPPVTDPPPPPPPPPPPRPPVADPPVSPPLPVACPECDRIAHDIELTRQAIAREDVQSEVLRRQGEENRRRQTAEEEKIRERQSEQDKGAWTAAGTDTASGITKEYDATRGDGRVYVTVRDAGGRVTDMYTYPRSRNATEIRNKVEAAERALQALREEQARIEEQSRAARERKARLEADLARLQAELADCLRRCRGGVPPAENALRIGSDVPAGGGCVFPAPSPVTIGPREQFGYGEGQKAAEVGKVALGFLGGLLGGRGGGLGGALGGGGGMLPGAADSGKPRLADDPVRDKAVFTDTATGTAIKVGGQYRPDGKLLVSVDVDKAEDKGVVHQATLERLQPQPDGSCKLQVARPIEWQHYEIWEDWWAKIRIQRYESVDGGPWRKTHDSGWQDWGSGARLLESGMLPADQIPGTAWGSMGADRAFGGPRSAGALFDPGPPAASGAPAAERLVVHVTRPGQDPVTTVPFVLYPTYDAGGKVSYGDKPPGLGGK